MKILFRITAILLIKVMLFVSISWAADIIMSPENHATLSPTLQIPQEIFKLQYQEHIESVQGMKQQRSPELGISKITSEDMKRVLDYPGMRELFINYFAAGKEFKAGKFSKALEYMDKIDIDLIAKSLPENEIDILALVMMYKVIVYKSLSNLKGMKNTLDIILTLPNINDDMRFLALQDMGTVLNSLDKFEWSVKYFKKAKMLLPQISEKIKNEHEAELYYNHASVLMQAAMKFLQKYQQTPPEKRQDRILEAALSLYQEAIAHYLEREDIAKALNKIIINLAYCHLGIGKIKLLQGRDAKEISDEYRNALFWIELYAENFLELSFEEYVYDSALFEVTDRINELVMREIISQETVELTDYLDEKYFSQFIKKYREGAYSRLIHNVHDEKAAAIYQLETELVKNSSLMHKGVESLDRMKKMSDGKYRIEALNLLISYRLFLGEYKKAHKLLNEVTIKRLEKEAGIPAVLKNTLSKLCLFEEGKVKHFLMQILWDKEMRMQLSNYFRNMLDSKDLALIVILSDIYEENEELRGSLKKLLVSAYIELGGEVVSEVNSALFAIKSTAWKKGKKAQKKRTQTKNIERLKTALEDLASEFDQTNNRIFLGYAKIIADEKLIRRDAGMYSILKNMFDNAAKKDVRSGKIKFFQEGIHAMIDDLQKANLNDLKLISLINRYEHLFTAEEGILDSPEGEKVMRLLSNELLRLYPAILPKGKIPQEDITLDEIMNNIYSFWDIVKGKMIICDGNIEINIDENYKMITFEFSGKEKIDMSSYIKEINNILVRGWHLNPELDWEVVEPQDMRDILYPVIEKSWSEVKQRIKLLEKSIKIAELKDELSHHKFQKRVLDNTLKLITRFKVIKENSAASPVDIADFVKATQDVGFYLDWTGNHRPIAFAKREGINIVKKPETGKGVIKNLAVLYQGEWRAISNSYHITPEEIVDIVETGKRLTGNYEVTLTANGKSRVCIAFSKSYDDEIAMVFVDNSDGRIVMIDLGEGLSEESTSVSVIDEKKLQKAIILVEQAI